MKNEFSRRVQLDKLAPAEKAIYDAIQEVEKVGADVKLTESIILLLKAKDLVSDYVDIQSLKEEVSHLMVLVENKNAYIDTLENGPSLKTNEGCI